MFRDERRDKVWNEIRQHDLRAFTQLTPELFAEAARRANVRIGQSALNLVNLVWLGIAAARQHSASFGIVLTSTLKLLEDQEGFSRTPLGKAQRPSPADKKGKKRKARPKSKHDPRGQKPAEVTEEAFAQARQKMPLPFWTALLLLLAEQFQKEHRQHLDCHGFRLLAMDGSTLVLPNDQRLRAHYGTPKNGCRKRAAPQARMLMITLPGTRIPIAYEIAPLKDSELKMAGRMMGHIRPNDLLLMDRGYFCYGLFWQIQNRGAYFGTRLKGRINYKKRKCLGRDDWLVDWTPKDSRGRWKELPRSIQLRLIRYKIRGFRASALITNVLDPRRLSREDWLQMASECDSKGQLAPGLYHRRWQIESTFFELKVTLRLKSLRSLTPKSLEYELAGRVVHYLLLRWLIVRAAEKHRLDPLQISFTNAVQELELARSSLLTASLPWLGELLPRLLDRVASHLVPSRPGRHYPRPKDTKPKASGRKRKPRPNSKLSNRINTKHKKTKRSRTRQA